MLALAPDASSAAAGKKLSSAGPWSDTGAGDAPAAVWGLCRGSGTKPYQTVVDLSGPAYKCTCPSRKFPCKHALGLLLLWSAGPTPPGAPPEWAATWLDDRARRQEAAANLPLPQAQRPGADQDDAAKRTQQRTDRVTAGLDELDRWLTDQVRSGLAGLERAGYGPFDTVAARMVDAQAPGLASSLRRLPTVVAGGKGWPGQLLEELALLRLTVSGHRRIESLPAELASSVRREVGYPVAKDEVLASPAVADVWQVVALRDEEQERLTTRRVWLHGERTGRLALVLSFAPPNQPLDATLVPGTSIDADVHFYPGALPLRALVGTRRGEPGLLTTLMGAGLDEARRAFARAVAADPWTSAWPIVLDGLVPVPAQPHWSAVDGAGHQVPLLAADSARWRLLAVSAGRPVAVVGELTVGGLRPLSVLGDNRLVLL